MLLKIAACYVRKTRAVRLNQNKELKEAKLMRAAESGGNVFVTMSDTFYIQVVM